MADHRASGRPNPTCRTELVASAPRTPAPAAEPLAERSAVGRPPRRGIAGAAPGLRVLLAAIVAAALSAAAVVVAGAVTGTTQAAAGSAPPAETSATVQAHVPLSARTDSRAVAQLAASRRRAVSRDSVRRVRTARADRRLERAAEAKASARQAALAELDANAAQRSEELAEHIWALPIAGGYRLTAEFGECSGLWSRCHTGTDFATSSGTPIHSVAAGEITEAGYDGAYGNKTVVTLEDGTELWYCHQTSIEVSVGDSVVPGQQIGTVGSTGNTTGPHLHLEVHPRGGDPVDPATALAAHGVSP